MKTQCLAAGLLSIVMVTLTLGQDDLATGFREPPASAQPHTGACIIDWPNWTDKTELPKILYKTSVDEVHILHELIHLIGAETDRSCVHRYAHCSNHLEDCRCQDD